MRLSSPSFGRDDTAMKALIFFLLSFSFNSFAQMYRMTGNFTLFGNSFSPLRSTYTLTWRENGSNIEGKYSDNVLAANAGITGVKLNGKRTFQVVLPTPDTRHGVKSLTIETTDFEGLNANVTTTILSKDINGNPIESTVTFAGITPEYGGAIQAQEASRCSTGFGMLTGFCGLYSGNTDEQSDVANVCQLTGTRLELAVNGDLSLYFNYNGNLRGIPRHNFGSLLGTPMSQNINTTVRHCGPLPGTNLNSISCKVLRFVGSFQDFGSLKNFTGTYDIRDEVTGNTCSYSLNLGREVMY